MLSTEERAKAIANGHKQRAPDDIDKLVGSRVRARRIDLGLTQQQLAEMAGCTSQQQHKREMGVNRFSSASLYRTANALGMTVDDLFEGADADEPQASEVQAPRLLLELAQNVRGIKSRKVQESLVVMARALAET